MRSNIFLAFLFTVTIISASGDTGNNTSTQQNTDSQLVMATWALAGVTVAIGIVTSITMIKSNRTTEKQNKTSTLLEIFKTMSSKESRDDRSIAYDARKEYVKRKNDIAVFYDPLYHKGVGSTLATLNRVGMLIQTNIALKQEFLDLYADTIILLWKSLNEYWQDQKSKRQNKFYMAHFKWLSDEAISYWTNTYPNEPIPELF